MRIKLDLSQFLEDERKFSVVKVNPKETKTVRDVLLKISKLFNVSVGIEDADDASKKPTLGLFEDENFYIHPDETATVLQDTGVLKLKTLPKHGGRKKKKSKKESPDDEISYHDERKEKKSKREKVEEELLEQNSTNKEERKERKLIRLSDDLISIENDDDDDEEENRKIRKRKRNRITEESGGLEGYEFQMQKKSKKNKTCEEFSEDEDEALMKQRGKTKREKHVDDLTSEEEEVYSKKKLKKNKVREDLEAEYVDEIVEVSVPRKRKSKRDVDLIVEEKKKKTCEFSTQKDLKGMRKRGGWNVSDEELYEMKAHPQAERRKGKSKEEKCSQEKVVSTSSVINLETEEALENSDSSSSSESNQQKYHTMSLFSDHNSKHFAADSMTDPLTIETSLCFGSKRRKRKHNKRKKQWREQEDQGTLPSEPSYNLQVHSKPSTSQAQSSKYQWPGRSQQPILNSSFTRKHVHFTSDDEETRNEENLPRDIEIVETASSATAREDSFEVPNTQNIIGQVTGRTRKMNPDLLKSESLDTAQTCIARSSRSRDVSQKLTRQRIVPVDLEAEDGDSFSPSKDTQSFRSRIPDPGTLTKTTPSTSSSNFDELATLRRICENKTITVCKVDAKKEQTRPRIKEAIPSPTVASSYLSPPSPVYVPQRPSEEATQTFHKIMKMHNGPATVIRNPRNIVQLDDTDLSCLRNRGSECYVRDSNGKSIRNHLPSESQKTNGQGLPGSGITTSAMSKSPSAIQQLHNRQGGQKGEVTQVTRTEEYRETRTTKVLSSIINEPSQKVPPPSPHSRPREVLQRVPQSLGAVLSSLRDQNGGSTEKDRGELEVLSNNLTAISTPDKHSVHNRQLLAERLAQTQDTHLKTQFPGASPRIRESHQRPTNQQSHTVPTKMESEVVDLESEEEIEIPVAESVEIKTPNCARNPVERNGPSELVKTSKNDVKETLKVVPPSNDRSDKAKSTAKSTVQAVGNFEGKPSVSKLILDGGKNKESVDPLGIMQSKGKSQDFANIYDDIEDEEFALEDEEGVEEEEVVEEEEDEDEDDEIRVEEDGDGAEVVPEIIEDDMSDVDDELGDIPPELRAISKSEESTEFESEMNSRLKKCLEKISQSSTKSDIDTVMNQECVFEISKLNSERTMNTTARLGNENVLDVGNKTEDNQKDMAGTVKRQNKNELKSSTSQEAKASSEEVEEVMMEEAEEKNTKEGTSTSEEPSPMKEGELKEEWLKNCPVMIDPPTVGQCVAVKRLVVEDAYCPIYSDYLQARVVKVEGTKVHLSFIENSKTKQNPGRGVEEVDLTSEEAGLEKVGEGATAIEELDWRDLDEPRLLTSMPVTCSI